MLLDSVRCTGAVAMAEGIDWNLTTFEGNRRRQQEEFHALSFREKLEVIEEMGEVVEYFMKRREARGLPVRRTIPPAASQ